MKENVSGCFFSEHSVFGYIFVCVNCCVPVLLCSRCYAECLCLYSRLSDYRSYYLDSFNELPF